jgi:hypothetical protein
VPSARAGQHRRAAARSSRNIPILPVGAAVVLLVVVIAVVIAIVNNQGSGARKVANVSCDVNEQVATHYHSHLSIVYQGNELNVPANIGIQSNCLYWLHTHDTTGVIHIEAPKAQANHTFTLGDFFNVMNKPLSKTQVADITLTNDQKLVIYIDGKVQPDGTDPRKIGLKNHELIVLEITPPTVDPPPSYTWPAGL